MAAYIPATGLGLWFCHCTCTSTNMSWKWQLSFWQYLPRQWMTGVLFCHSILSLQCRYSWLLEQPSDDDPHQKQVLYFIVHCVGSEPCEGEEAESTRWVASWRKCSPTELCASTPPWVLKCPQGVLHFGLTVLKTKNKMLWWASGYVNFYFLWR